MTELDRFAAAQAPVHADVLRELRSGRKTTHWMWFVFPQLKGLGRSETADLYGLSGLVEARAYLAHPLLGARLRECTAIVNALDGRSAEQIFGPTDAMKFRSCMTLFELAAEPASAFAQAIKKYFDGRRDERTLALVGRPGG
jgi:uncharacterized protein (DUF1810 family)